MCTTQKHFNYSLRASEEGDYISRCLNFEHLISLIFIEKLQDMSFYVTKWPQTENTLVTTLIQSN